MNLIPKMFHPISIGNVEIKNRFVMLPMTTMFADNYYITDAMVDFYEQRAKGGTGLIEIGSVYVSDLFDTEPKYYTTSGAAGAWDDSFVPGWKSLRRLVIGMGLKWLGSFNYATSGELMRQKSCRFMLPQKKLFLARLRVCLRRNSLRENLKFW